MIKFIGNFKKTNTQASYFKTGFYELDRAFNSEGKNLGIPYGHIHEWFGSEHTGKSTTMYSLASMLSRHLDSGYVVMDVEGSFDPIYAEQIGVAQGMTQDHSVDLASGDYHEDMMKDLLERLENPSIDIGIVDSVGAMASRGELMGEFGERNMGQRAFIMGQFLRSFLHRKDRLETIGEHSTLFLINHNLSALSAYGGSYQPGGKAKSYLAGVRVFVTVEKVSYGGKATKRLPDQSFMVKAKINKLRWQGGGEGNEFRYFIKNKWGMHKGISNMFTAIKLCDNVKRGRTIKIDENSVGSLYSLIEKDFDKPEKFEPFEEALSKLETKNRS